MNVYISPREHGDYVALLPSAGFKKILIVGDIQVNRRS